MPPLAPVVGALISAAPVIFAGAAVYGAVKTSQAQGQALSEAKKQRQLQAAQAGEYVELTKKQMELQSQESQITTLAELLLNKKPTEPLVYTTPAAKEFSPIESINQAIDKLIRG